MIPVWRPEEKVLSGEQITAEDVSFIKNGVTSRNTIEARIGSAGYFWVNHRVMIYVWTMRQGAFIVATMAPYPAAGEIDIPQKNLLLIQLDVRDRVRRHEIVYLSAFQTTRSRTEWWLSKPLEE